MNRKEIRRITKEYKKKNSNFKSMINNIGLRTDRHETEKVVDAIMKDSQLSVQMKEYLLKS